MVARATADGVEQLNSIESMRVDGKFMIGDEIPEGQGRVVSLLAECFEICQDLRVNSGGSDEE